MLYRKVARHEIDRDAELIAEMRRFARGQPFDEDPMPAFDSEVSDFRVASELFAPVRTPTRRNIEPRPIIIHLENTAEENPHV